jgi:leucyl-tRNA synthetase
VPRYNPAEIEPRWQRIWEQNQTFRTPDDPSLEKYYVLDMFPYPSGEGLHVGHPEGYTATDILARFQRMKGKAVLHPMGFDAFGLPAEEAAIKRNVPPREFTEKNIANFRRQLKMLGFSYDWGRQISTTDIPYVRWTQWIFLQLYDTWFDEQSQRGRPIVDLPIPAEVSARGEAAIVEYQDSFRLAYEGDALVNWCPALGTVLANEEVVDGRSEHGHAVQRIPLRQWMLRITSYAERLEKDLEQVDWPEGIKKLQRDWIGRSTGAEVDFLVGDLTAFDQWTKSRKASGFPRTAEPNVLRVYTTRPDTLFGATYMVIAPEHPLVSQITTPAQAAEVEAYCSAAASKSDRDRQDDKKSKTGVFTGTYAINPLTRKPIPIWIADYVLINYGTGAIMAVPAHDNRDFEFARQFGLPIVAVVKPPEKNTDVDWPSVLAGASCFSGEGIATNSGTFDGLSTEEFKTKIKQQLSTQGIGREAVNFKLRDWLFSRQRFWGEPFPILHELDAAGKPTGRKRAVPADSLPVDLPHLDDFKPHGRPEAPLAKAPDSWLHPVIDGVRYRREINTMPQWAGSCWYYLRFIDPRNEKAVVDRELEKRWMPVDLYVGGAEHAVLHLLYARFWHKVLFDRGVVSTVEPFKKLVNQGMILGEMEFTGYRDSTEKWVSSDLVIEAENNALVLARDKSPVVSVKLDPDQVEKSGEKFVLKSDPTIRIDSRAYKMSKSRGNVINPDEIVADYGADSLRLYEMFMGPLEASKPWSMAGVNGVRGFLDRVWRMIIDDRAETKTLNESIVDTAPTDEQLRVLHKTIKAVSQDIENLSFNTAIARLMEFVNYFTKQTTRPRSIMSKFILILSPLAPHIAEELWAILGHKQTLAYEPWPTFDESLTVDQSVEIPISIQGKLRSKINIARGMSNDEVEKIALLDERIAELLVGKTVKKVIIVPDRMVNIVAN